MTTQVPTIKDDSVNTLDFGFFMHTYFCHLILNLENDSMYSIPQLLSYMYGKQLEMIIRKYQNLVTQNDKLLNDLNCSGELN